MNRRECGRIVRKVSERSLVELRVLLRVSKALVDCCSKYGQGGEWAVATAVAVAAVVVAAMQVKAGGKQWKRGRR